MTALAGYLESHPKFLCGNLDFVEGQKSHGRVSFWLPRLEDLTDFPVEEELRGSAYIV